MPISTQDINRFGNFAMIGSDANSSGSNWNPIDKKNRYLDTKSNQVSVASLKFRIMLQKCQDNYDAGIKDDNTKRPFSRRSPAIFSTAACLSRMCMNVSEEYITKKEAPVKSRLQDKVPIRRGASINIITYY